MNLKFTIRYNKPGFMGWLAVFFYGFMLYELATTGSGWYLVGAILWAWLIQVHTGMHFPKSQEPQKP
jgi:hypothetical protein